MDTFIVTPCETPERIHAAMTLLEKHYPHLQREELHAMGDIMLEENWKQIGVFVGERCIATVMYRIGMRFFAGKHMVTEALYIDEEFRRAGLAHLLFEWLEVKARQEGCHFSLLYSYADNILAHKFFYKRGFCIKGYVFFKEINPKAPVTPHSRGALRWKRG
jgi:GNAT superfamily N-acetyltransferase